MIIHNNQTTMVNNHDRKIYLSTLKNFFKVKYHPMLNRLSYAEIRRIYSATKKVGS